MLIQKSRRLRKLVYAAAICAGAGASPLLATNYTWNVGSGTYSTQADWSPSAPVGGPGAADTAQFSLTTSYTTTFTSSPTTSGLELTGGNVFFTASGSSENYTATTANIHGGNLTLTGSALQMKLTTTNLSVYSNSTVTVNQGNDLVATSLSVSAPTGAGTLLFDGSGSTFTVSGAAVLSSSGAAAAALTFQNAAP